MKGDQEITGAQREKVESLKGIDTKRGRFTKSKVLANLDAGPMADKYEFSSGSV